MPIFAALRVSETRVKTGAPDGNEALTETVLGSPLTEIVALVGLADTEVDPRAAGFEETTIVLGTVLEPGFEVPDVERGAQLVPAVSALAAGSALTLVAQSVICW